MWFFPVAAAKNGTILSVLALVVHICTEREHLMDGRNGSGIFTVLCPILSALGHQSAPGPGRVPVSEQRSRAGQPKAGRSRWAEHENLIWYWAFTSLQTFLFPKHWYEQLNSMWNSSLACSSLTCNKLLEFEWWTLPINFWSLICLFSAVIL